MLQVNKIIVFRLCDMKNALTQHNDCYVVGALSFLIDCSACINSKVVEGTHEYFQNGESYIKSNAIPFTVGNVDSLVSPINSWRRIAICTTF